MSQGSNDQDRSPIERAKTRWLDDSAAHLAMDRARLTLYQSRKPMLDRHPDTDSVHSRLARTQMPNARRIAGREHMSHDPSWS